MTSNRGLIMIIGAVGLTTLLAAAGCGGSSDSSPAQQTPAGGAAGATGGKGGAMSGTGGSAAGASSGAKKIGAECTADKDCGAGAKCLTETTNSFGDGAPAHGYCTVDCSTDGSVCGDKAICVGLTDTEAVCVLGCKFGEPPLNYLDDLDGDSAPDKCAGRKDVACHGLFNDKGEYSKQDACFPMCNDDENCSAGRACDLNTGLCVESAKLKDKKKGNELCNVAAKDDECLGVCARLYDSTDPNTPAEKKDLGICLDPCTIGTIQGGSCGGVSNGLCLLTGMFTPTKDGPDGGAADLGACVTASKKGDSCSCHWEEGQWSMYFSGVKQSYCLFLGNEACDSTKDCAFTCDTNADCQSGSDTTSTCDKSAPNKAGKGQCKKSDGSYATLFDNLACLPVGAKGEKMCAPKDAADVSKCGGSNGNPGTGGTGGAGGAGGAGGSSAGAAGDSGAGGAAAGAGGDAGAGGAAAGAGGAGDSGAAGAGDSGAGGDAGAGG